MRLPDDVTTRQAAERVSRHSGTLALQAHESAEQRMQEAEQRMQEAEQRMQQAEQRMQQAEEQGKQEAYEEAFEQGKQEDFEDAFEQGKQEAEAGWSLLNDLCQLRCIQMQLVAGSAVACLQPPR